MSELDEVKAELARYKAMYDDENSDKVTVIKGWYDSCGPGEYYAAAVGDTYLAEAFQRLREAHWNQKNKQISLSWHVTDEPKSYQDLETNIIKAVMGDLKTTFSHRYSDLTGYLWTNEDVKLQGHDLLREIATACQGKSKAWVYIRFEVHDD